MQDGPLGFLRILKNLRILQATDLVSIVTQFIFFLLSSAISISVS